MFCIFKDRKALIIHWEILRLLYCKSGDFNENLTFFQRECFAQKSPRVEKWKTDHFESWPENSTQQTWWVAVKMPSQGMFLFKLSQGVTIDPSFCSQKHLEGYLTELFLKTPKKTTIVNHTLIYLIFSIFHSSQKTLYFLVFYSVSTAWWLD